jgi:rhomboid protease GluP
MAYYKIRYIFLPLLQSTTVTVLFYSLFHLAYVYSGLDILPRETINYVIPFVISYPIMFLFVYPKLKMIEERRRSTRGFGVFVSLTAFAIAIPVIGSQYFTSSTAGSLLRLQNISQIHQHPNAKFYILDSFYIDKSRAYFYEIFNRKNLKIKYTLYVALPLYTRAADTLDGEKISTWYGDVYEKPDIDRGTFNADDIRAQVKERFDSGDFSKVFYFRRLYKSREYDNYKWIFRDNDNLYKRKEIFLIGSHEPFSERSGNSFWWFLLAWLASSSVWCLILLAVPLDQHKLDYFLEHGTPQLKQRLKNTWDDILQREHN